MAKLRRFFSYHFKHKMLGFLSVLMVVFMTAFPALAFIERVSVDTAGNDSDAESNDPLISISSDGRYVAFISAASDIVAGDTNGFSDVFVRDTQTDVTERVSVDSFGAETTDGGSSYGVVISSDGRYVVFGSSSNDLVITDANPFLIDVFVHDRQTGTTEIVSVDSLGNQADGPSAPDSISADGRYVAFYSNATNLVAGDTNGSTDVFVHDRQTGTTEIVSINDLGDEGDSNSLRGSISADGRYVAFYSTATNLVLGDDNLAGDVFVHDRQTGTTEIVSVNDLGDEGNGDSYWPYISADGRYVNFQSSATNLVSGDGNGTTDFFTYDRQTNTIEIIPDLNPFSFTSFDQYASSDASYFSFSSASNLVVEDTNGFRDIYFYSKEIDYVERISVSNSGDEADGESYRSSISADGKYVAFQSSATNLVAVDGNGVDDIFLVQINTIKDITLDPAFIFENMPIGTNIGTLDALDANTSDTHTFSFACDTPGPDDASFTISGDQINSAEVFDYETKIDYDVCVRADDGNGDTFDHLIDINVLDAIPTDLTLSNDSIQEANDIGDEIGVFSTEISEPATFAYSFCGGADDASFLVDFNTGSLTAAEVFDYDVKNTYDICVYAEDQSSGEVSFDTFTINITETPPPPTGGGGGGGSSPRIYGCKDSSATNYNQNATVDDGSCAYPGTPGCTTSFALNYQSSATVDDGSCLYGPSDCNDPAASNYNPLSSFNDGSCVYPPPPTNSVPGCTNPQATNYQSSATVDNGSCVLPVTPPDTDVPGCTDQTASNFSSLATVDDGSCTYASPQDISGCTDVNALNYSSSATVDDGSCTYTNPVNPPPPPPTTTNPPSTGGGGGGFLKEKDLIKVAFGGIALSALLTTISEPGLIAGAASIPVRIWNMIPFLMGYKRKKRPWGTVYDSVTKQPLDPVYVTLKTKDGQDVSTSITDLDGRYGFLAEAGQYTITANKANYIFPSAKMAGKGKDELYDNLYFGGDIQVEKKEDVVFKNVPMDAINFNWNEFEKAKNKKLMKFYSKADLFLAHISQIVFVAGFASSVALFFLNNSILNTVILSMYVAILVLRIFGVKPRKSGRVTDKQGFPLSFGIIRAFSASMGREVSHSVIGKTGKYYMLVPNGEYFIKIQKKTGEDSYEDLHTTDAFKVKEGFIGERIKV